MNHKTKNDDICSSKKAKMIVFPNGKINIGLQVVNKRNDGFHDLQTVFYPLNWHDALELIPRQNAEKAFSFSTSGLQVAGELENNIVFKTWQLVKSHGFNIPDCETHLHKCIPMGAGLGGGSADAAFYLKLLNRTFSLGITPAQELNFARTLGSDCAFFIDNKPVYAEERGDVFSKIKLDLSSYYILVVYPQIHVNTKDAFTGVVPKTPKINLKEIVEKSHISEWQALINNDFESTVFKKYPKIGQLKKDLLSLGAIYASMSGSGSAVYGIFNKEPLIAFDPSYLFYLQKPIV